MNWKEKSAPDTLSVLLAGHEERVDRWYQALSGEDQFRVSSIAYTKNDLLAKLDGAQDLVLLDARCFSGPQGLMDAVPKIQSALFVFLPLNIDDLEAAQLTEDLTAFPQVHSVIRGEAELPELMQEMVEAGRAKQDPQKPDWGRQPGPAGSRPVSTRIIAVWNLEGGVGQTTLAANLAYLAAERGYQTLLVGMDQGDPLPLMIEGLKDRPNLTTWQSNPTPEGLKASLQTYSAKLHVIGGFLDSLSQRAFLEMEEANPARLPHLVDLALKEEYAVIILDIPSSKALNHTISAANAWVLPARATQAGMYRSVTAYRAVTKQWSGLHSITKSRIRVALTHLRRGHGLSPDAWHERASSFVEGSFPPVMATIPDLPRVGDLQDERLLPAQHDQAFREALVPLADSLFVEKGAGQGNGSYREERTFLGIKVRW